MAFRMLARHSIPPPHKHAWLRMLWLARKDGCFQFLLVIGSSSGNPLCSAIKLGGVKADILMLSLRARRRDSNSFECILPNLTPERGNVNVPKRRMSYAPPGSLVQPPDGPSRVPHAHPHRRSRSGSYLFPRWLIFKGKRGARGNQSESALCQIVGL